MAEKTFEQAMNELGKVVSQLEQGDISLEKSMKLYEKGISLSRFCGEELEKAQLKIEELKAEKNEESV